MARPSRPSAACKVQGAESRASQRPALRRVAGIHAETCASATATAARALELTILRATRTSETLNAVWSEFDLDRKLWTIPADRMKADREHRIPLSDRAVAIVRAMQKVRCSDFVFPGAKRGRPLSNMAMLLMLRRMKRGDLTAHGFRSSFRDWAAEETNYQNHVIEMALAHAIGDKVEAAYRRGDLFEKRRQLMDRMVGVLRQPRHRQRGCDPMTARKTTPHLKRGPSRSRSCRSGARADPRYHCASILIATPWPASMSRTYG